MINEHAWLAIGFLLGAIAFDLPWRWLSRKRGKLEAETQYQNNLWRGMACDRQYKIEALVNMLGPVGLKVWNRWQEQGVSRVHFSWGPKAAELTGEERAQHILDFEDAPREQVHDVDNILSKPSTGL